MKNILIVSATSGNNYILAQEVESLFKTKQANCKLIKLDDFSIPLYNPQLEKTTNNVDISKIDELFQNADGFIFCAPEYNGGVPPVLSNALTWVSVKSKNWRDAFNGKFAIIATHSGGNGFRFLLAIRNQLEHMGTNVLSRTISVSKDIPLNKDSARKILNSFVKII